MRFLSRVDASGGALPSASPLVVGVDSSGSAAGALFGTDTPLYRAAANVLRCNQLDQTVPTAANYTGSGTLTGGVASGTSTQAVITPFAMPFKGDLLMTGWVSLYGTGLFVASLAAAAMSGPAPSFAPSALFRTAGAPGSGQEIHVVPFMGLWTGLAAGVTVAPAVAVTYGGGAAVGLSNYGTVAHATRTL